MPFGEGCLEERIKRKKLGQFIKVYTQTFSFFFFSFFKQVARDIIDLYIQEDKIVIYIKDTKRQKIKKKKFPISSKAA